MTTTIPDYFTDRPLVASTDLLSPNARHAIDLQDAGLLLRTQLEQLPVNWPDHLEELEGLSSAEVARQARPWPHQSLAIDQAVEGLKESERGQIIMPCGTGKTYVGLWLAERLGAKRILMLAPALALVSRTLRDWTATAARPFEWIAVCSDQTVTDDAGRQAADQDSLELVSDLGVDVTTDPASIANFLRRPGPRVVFGTYQSSTKIAEAIAVDGVAGFDLTICDEAHRLAGRTNRAYGAVLDDRRIPSRRRVFMTATPRMYSTRVRTKAAEVDSPVASMDDVNTFGPVIHELSFGRAIAEDLLADYRVVVIGVLDKDYASMLGVERRLRVDEDDYEVDARTLAATVALAKAMRRYGLRRTISFHRSVARAKRFRGVVETLMDRFSNATRPSGSIDARHVNGTMTTAERAHILSLLARLDHADRMLVTNAKCLGEGIDVKAVDSIVFADPRRSRIEVVQAVGRAIRRSRDKVSTVVIPVPMPTEADPAEVFASSEWGVVWQVLSALRSHDARLGDEIDAIAAHRVLQGSVGAVPTRIVLDLPGFRVSLPEVEKAFTAKVVDYVGDSFSVGLAVCRAYNDEYGSIAGVKVQETYRGFPIGSWLNNRRHQGILSPDRIAALDELGMLWEPLEEGWEKSLAICRAYRDEHGSIAGVKHLESYKGYPIGYWLHTRRQFRKRGLLSADRIAALDELGMVWDARDRAWQEGLAMCRAYRDEYGSIAGVKVKETYRGFRIGNWLNNRRHKGLKQGLLTAEQIAALDELGMVWDPKEEMWNQGLAIGRAYRDQNGSINDVTRSTTYRDFPLGAWLNDRRHERRTGRLSPDRIAALDELGIDWDRSQWNWDKGIEACRDYANHNGSIAPIRTGETYDGFPIGRWVHARRQDRKNGRLSGERIHALDELGMVWDPRGKAWQQGFAMCQAYWNEFGSIEKVKPAETYRGFPIGRWLADRRRSHNAGYLAEDRVAALEELGAVWRHPAAGKPAGQERTRGA